MRTRLCRTALGARTDRSGGGERREKCRSLQSGSGCLFGKLRRDGGARGGAELASQFRFYEQTFQVSQKFRRRTCEQRAAVGHQHGPFEAGRPAHKRQSRGGQFHRFDLQSGRLQVEDDGGGRVLNGLTHLRGRRRLDDANLWFTERNLPENFRRDAARQDQFYLRSAPDERSENRGEELRQSEFFFPSIEAARDEERAEIRGIFPGERWKLKKSGATSTGPRSVARSTRRSSGVIARVNSIGATQFPEGGILRAKARNAFLAKPGRKPAGNPR